MEHKRLKEISVDNFIEGQRVRKGQVYAQLLGGLPVAMLYGGTVLGNKDKSKALNEYLSKGRLTKKEKNDVYKKYGL